MEKTLKIILSVLLLASTQFAAHAQSPPRLKVSKDSPTTMQISWTNVIGTSYRLQFTPTLSSAVWKPLEDAFSSDSNVLVSVSTTTTPATFFRVQIPTNGTLPAVQIFSPTNGQIVSGIITVGAGAQVGSQLQGANLYLDTALIGFVDSGGIAFDLDTTHFANGLHTLSVGAVDAGNSETASSTITLDFENAVRWLDADSLFQSFVPIDVQSDIFPATWTVFVSNTNGTIIRTFSGSTSDGNISTSWDGNDNNGVYAPDQAGYNILVVVTSSGGSSSMMSSRSLAGSSRPPVVSEGLNPYGVMEYEIEESLPDPMLAYSNLLHNYLQMPEKERIIFPPFESLANEPNAPITKKISAYDMLMLQHPTSSAGGILTADVMSPNGNSGSSSGSTGAAVWREAPWTSGQIILSKVTIPGIFNTVIQNYLLQLRDLVDAAEDSVGNNRGVFGPDMIYVLNNGGDFTALKGNLASTSPDVRAFYFYGHGNLDGSSIGSSGAGVSSVEINILLGNFYLPFRGGNPLKIITHKPFSFVFLDGCMTGKGSFPEAFGIPKVSSDVSYNDFHKHKRAFMGWGGILSFQFNNTYFNWTQAFWNSWLDDTAAYTKPLQQAIDDASGSNPGVTNSVPMMIYGSRSITWGD